MSSNHGFIPHRKAIGARAGTRYVVEGEVYSMGSDIVVFIHGGRAHVGAVGISVARPSGKRRDRPSETTSVFTMLGHKEDEIVVPAARKMVRSLGRSAIVIAGVHFDNLTSRQINLVKKCAEKVVDRLIAKVQNEERKKRR